MVLDANGTMIVSELIQHLITMPSDAEVRLYWDSGARGEVEAIYQTDDEKHVVIAGEWSLRDHNVALKEGMDLLPVFTEDKSLPHSVSERHKL